MIDFSYLKPGQEVYSIKHDSYYLKHGEGKKHVRKLFFHQEYDEYEKEKISEFEQYIQKHNVLLPQDWSQELTLKYCYSGGFDMAKMEIRSCLPSHDTIGRRIFRYLYSFGRDYQFRPVLYIQLHLVSKLKLDVHILLQAAAQLGNVIVQNMYVKGYVENWIVIVDIGGSGILDFPFSTISLINDTLSINYTSSLHKMFILNPSFLFSATWKLVEKVLHPETASKICFLKPAEYSKLQEFIPAEEIEMKYGGLHQNLTTFWPIINTRPAQPADEIQYNTLTKRQTSILQSEYYSIENNSKVFFSSAKAKDYRIHEQFNELERVQPAQSSCCGTCQIM